MSGDPTSQTETSSSRTAATAPSGGKKPRSPVERVIVWGGIVVLLLALGVQAHGRFGYEWTLKNLQPLVDDDYEGGEPLALADVDSHIVGFPSRSETPVARTRTDRVYRWYGLGRSYGITISYNPTVDPVVVTGLETDNAPLPPPAPEVDEPDQMTEPPMGTGGTGSPMVGGGGPPMHNADGSSGGGGPGGGPGGGGARFNPMDNDADGDGKLSLEEVPERWRENFAERDTNGDGLIDEAELEAMREQFRSQRQQGGENGGGRPQRPAAEGAGDRPQRPAAEGAGDPAAPDTAPPTGSDEQTSDAPAAGTDQEDGTGSP